MPKTRVIRNDSFFSSWTSKPFLPWSSPTFLRTDIFWGEVIAMKNRITNTPRFPLMARIVRAVMTIPNSSAECETIFSMMKKIHSDTRSNLDNSTLCALLTLKVNNTQQCHSFKPSKDILKTAKKACVGYNISCSSSQ